MLIIWDAHVSKYVLFILLRPIKIFHKTLAILVRLLQLVLNLCNQLLQKLILALTRLLCYRLRSTRGVLALILMLIVFDDGSVILHFIYQFLIS